MPPRVADLGSYNDGWAGIVKTLTGVGPSARESEGVTALSKSEMCFCQAGSEDAAFGSYAPRCRLYYDRETVHNSIMADTCLLMLLSPCSVAWFSAVVAVVGFNPASVPEDTGRKTEGKTTSSTHRAGVPASRASLGHAPEQPDAGVTCASGLVRVQHRYCRYLPCIPSSCHGGSVTQPASKRRVPGKQETLRHALDVPKDINHWTASTTPLSSRSRSGTSWLLEWHIRFARQGHSPCIHSDAETPSPSGFPTGMYSNSDDLLRHGGGGAARFAPSTRCQTPAAEEVGGGEMSQHEFLVETSRDFRCPHRSIVWHL